MNRSRSTIKLVGAKYIGSFVAFAATSYFAQTLGPSTLGSFFLFETVLAFLVLPSGFGVRDAVAKFLSEDEDGRSGYLSAATLLVIAPITVISIGILVFRESINAYIGVPVAGLLVAGLVLKTYGHIFVKALEGEFQIGAGAGTQALRQIVWAGAGIVLIALGTREYALFYGMVGGYAAMVIVGIFITDSSFERPSRRQVRDVFNFSKYNVVARIGAYSHSWVDVAMIGFLLSSTAVGHYEVAWRVTIVVMILGRAVARVTFPQVSQWDQSGHSRDIEQLLSDAILVSLVVAIPATVGSVLLGEEILELLFGDSFVVASIALVILMVDKIIQSVHILFSNVLRALNEPSLVARGTLLALVVNIVLNGVLIHLYGIEGAATATLVALFVNTVIHGYYLSQIVTVNVPLRGVTWCTGAAVVMGACLGGIQQFVLVNSLPVLIAVVGGCAIIYLSLIGAYRPVRMTFQRYGLSGPTAPKE